MAEPIPSASTAAADAADDETSQNLPNNAEDRKAAAALNSLNANEMSTENGEAAAKQPSAADQEALGKAMSRLEVASGISKKKEDTKKAETKKEVEVKKKIKISAEDVTFLVGADGAVPWGVWCLVLTYQCRLRSSIFRKSKLQNYCGRTTGTLFSPSRLSLHLQ